MDQLICYEELFESIPDYRKVVLLMFFKKNDVNFFRRMWISEN